MDLPDRVAHLPLNAANRLKDVSASPWSHLVSSTRLTSSEEGSSGTEMTEFSFTHQLQHQTDASEVTKHWMWAGGNGDVGVIDWAEVGGLGGSLIYDN